MVRARHVFDVRHVGAPGIAHGGAVATVLDDLFGFVLYLVGEPAVTRHLEVGYRAPVLLGVPYLLEARLDRREGRKLFLRADGVDERGAPVLDARAVFVIVGFEHFAARYRRRRFHASGRAMTSVDPRPSGMGAQAATSAPGAPLVPVEGSPDVAAPLYLCSALQEGAPSGGQRPAPSGPRRRARRCPGSRSWMGWGWGALRVLGRVARDVVEVS